MTHTTWRTQGLGAPRPKVGDDRSVRRRPSKARPATSLLLAACLAGSLALAGCSNGDSPQTTGTQQALAVVSSSTPAPTSGTGTGVVARTATPSSSSPAPATSSAPQATAGPGIATLSGARPTVSQPASWTPPDLHFYNEDYTVWYRDDGVVNTDAVTERGNIEGYRTYDGMCLGYETRDIDQAIHFSTLDDDSMSSSLVDVQDQTITDYTETSRTTVDLIRDDTGTLEGYSTAWTGTFTQSGQSRPVEGYSFARGVRDAGLQFSVLVVCEQGSLISEDQWHTILSGIRIDGLEAGKMS